MKIDLAPALHLLHRCPAAVLATHSLQRPGFPCATTAIAAEVAALLQAGPGAE